MSKRAKCSQCDFLESRCLCAYLFPIENQTTLIILQHPSETDHALNTVRLMKKTFQKIIVITDEKFSLNSQFMELYKNFKESMGLLFLSPSSLPIENYSDRKLSSKITHLVLLDGTWKKAKKIFHLSPELHSLPNYALKSQQKSQYRLRKSPIAGALSTLEASVLALKIVEPTINLQSLELLEKAFDKMIENQIDKMGQETYQENYLRKKTKEK